jgi:hypothetical protein
LQNVCKKEIKELHLYKQLNISIMANSENKGTLDLPVYLASEYDRVNARLQLYAKTIGALEGNLAMIDIEEIPTSQVSYIKRMFEIIAELDYENNK